MLTIQCVVPGWTASLSPVSALCNFSERRDSQDHWIHIYLRFSTSHCYDGVMCQAGPKCVCVLCFPPCFLCASPFLCFQVISLSGFHLWAPGRPADGVHKLFPLLCVLSIKPLMVCGGRLWAFRWVGGTLYNSYTGSYFLSRDIRCIGWCHPCICFWEALFFR